jgi:hypothetical protein
MAFIGMATLLSVALLCTGCRSYNQRYVAERSDLEPEVRQAILQKQIIVGMFPDEAWAAGGSFFCVVQTDEKQWGTNLVPPYRIILAQRSHPDSSKIEMTFRNRTQFGTCKPVPFTVIFNQGRAVSITRNE